MYEPDLRTAGLEIDGDQQQPATSDRIEQFFVGRRTVDVNPNP